MNQQSRPHLFARTFGRRALLHSRGVLGGAGQSFSAKVPNVTNALGRGLAFQLNARPNARFALAVLKT